MRKKLLYGILLLPLALFLLLPKKSFHLLSHARTLAGMNAQFCGSVIIRFNADGESIGYDSSWSQVQAKMVKKYSRREPFFAYIEASQSSLNPLAAGKLQCRFICVDAQNKCYVLEWLRDTNDRPMQSSSWSKYEAELILGAERNGRPYLYTRKR